jgi:hypothetical protein
VFALRPTLACCCSCSSALLPTPRILPPPQLVDWMLWHNENQQPFSWLGGDWGARGGITARELALWTTLQREYRARGLLPGEALSRFEAIGVQWESTTVGAWARSLLGCLGLGLGAWCLVLWHCRLPLLGLACGAARGRAVGSRSWRSLPTCVLLLLFLPAPACLPAGRHGG